MSPLRKVEYTVLLVFPGFGDKRANAEQIVEEALHHLNTEKDEPGWRFAQNVTARLDIVPDADQARDRMQTDSDLAMMILHDLDEDERSELTQECAARGVVVCHTHDTEPNPDEEPRPRRARQRGWKVVFRKSRSDEPRAHQIPASTLTAPAEGDEEELS
jgi:hypothetical protein